MEASEGFAPVERGDARILVLGSLPGRRSIAAQQYYAHPRNAFWPIMKDVLGIDGGYEERCQQLLASRIALWDVLASSVRPGSMDAAIRNDSARVNDFATFFGRHAGLCMIAFNGRKAEELFTRFVGADAAGDAVERVGLPSTSPAYAAMPYPDKLARWREAVRRVL